MPLIVYYPVERGVLDIPLRIKGRHSFGQLDGYDNALQGVDFRRFFEWFRDREDSENEDRSRQTSKTYKLFFEAVKLGNTFDFKAAVDQLSTQDKPLLAVRHAIKTFMNDFENLRIQRKPRLQMLVDKNGKTFDVAQLS